MISNLLIYKILQFLSIMAIGYIIAKLKIVNSADSGVLSKITLYLLMPSAIINAFNFKVSGELLKGLSLSFIVAIVIHLVYLLLDRLYLKIKGNDIISRASVIYSNAGNLIIPIVTFILGDEWVVYSTAFLSVQLFFLWTHGIRIFSPKEKFDIKKILLNVNIIAIVIGLFSMIFGWQLPEFAKDITSSFSSMLGPVSMLIAGMLAAKVDFKRSLKKHKLYVVSVIRLIVFPLITLLILKAISSISSIENSQQILLITFLACMTPSASTVMQLAQIKGVDTDFAVEINIFTTVMCIFTMPLMVALYSCFI